MSHKEHTFIRYPGSLVEPTVKSLENKIDEVDGIQDEMLESQREKLRSQLNGKTPNTTLFAIFAVPYSCDDCNVKKLRLYPFYMEDIRTTRGRNYNYTDEQKQTIINEASHTFGTKPFIVETRADETRLLREVKSPWRHGEPSGDIASECSSEETNKSN